LEKITSQSIKEISANSAHALMFTKASFQTASFPKTQKTIKNA